MLILIAESKTMSACTDAVSNVDYSRHAPAFAAEADSIMESLRGYKADALAEAVKISPAMAAKLSRMIYDFPDKRTGGKAISAFTGVVFRAFSHGTLSPGEQTEAAARVRIISSLYGWLCPDDIVKPYRFDFNTRPAPGMMTFSAYWRKAVTAILLKQLKENGFTSVLNLLPADAARCIDWREVAKHARVVKAEFRELLPGGASRTPDSSRLKTLRGLLLRRIITDNITSPDALATLCSNDYAADGIDSNGNVMFLTVKEP